MLCIYKNNHTIFMGKKLYNQMTFITPYVEKRKIKDDFFNKINFIIDWSRISKKIRKIL